MQVQVSFTTKVMVILMLMMLTVTVVIATILIRQSSENIQRQHYETQVENEHRYALFNRELNNRTVIWLDAFTSIALAEEQNLEHLVTSLQESREYLYINMQVEDLWLFDGSREIRYADSPPPLKLLEPHIENTQQEFATTSLLYCTSQCRQYLFIPVMTSGNRLPVIVLSMRLQELLSLLGESTGTRLALVQRSDDVAKAPLTVASRLSESYRKEIDEVLTRLQGGSIAALIEEGRRIELENESFLVNLLPMSPGKGTETFILLVQDITEQMQQASRYKTLVVGSAVLLFALFAVLMYLFINQYRNKLLDIASRLPMLAQHRYDDFKIAKQEAERWRSTRFTDELDVLEATADDLAYKLEDIDSRMAMNTAQLEKMAMFDTLTGLPNRNMLTYQIEKQLAGTSRDNHIVALMFLDLDDFKKVNDSHGHDVGDRLLKAAAARITAPLRDTDIASRFGGDELVVLLSHIANREQAEVVAKKLLDAFSTPIDVDGMQFYITVSIGIAITKQSQGKAVDLLRHADIAMYEAKELQGASFRIYDATMNLKVMRKVELESEARIALREDQFWLALQPQIDLKTRKLVGFEALLRWSHPTKGFIPPNEFIPTLENTAFMLELDYWVITRATRLLRELSINGFNDVKMAINLSSGHFLDPSLPEFLEHQIIEQGVAPSLLTLELTETVLVSDINRATSVMERIRAMGCLIAIDDFGTGYSSLSYLKSLPADYIKIDQSFIAGMVDSPDDRSIVYSTISMVRNMGLLVIAEGIEVNAQYELLCHFDCHQGQGYLISKPIPEADLWATLQQQIINGVWATELPVFEANRA